MTVLGWALWNPSTGQTLMIWSVRLAVLFYLLRLFVLLRRSDTARVPRTSECVLWSLGCACYLAHVILAFECVHHWSHQLALDHTAAETQRVTGLGRGDGIWVNYLFTGIWIADVVRLVFSRQRERETARPIDIGIQLLFAFIVFNATVVFGPPVYRLLAVPVLLVLLSARLIRWG